MVPVHIFGNTGKVGPLITGTVGTVRTTDMGTAGTAEIRTAGKAAIPGTTMVCLDSRNSLNR